MKHHEYAILVVCRYLGAGGKLLLCSYWLFCRHLSCFPFITQKYFLSLLQKIVINKYSDCPTMACSVLLFAEPAYHCAKWKSRPSTHSLVKTGLGFRACAGNKGVEMGRGNTKRIRGRSFSWHVPGSYQFIVLIVLGNVCKFL